MAAKKYYEFSPESSLGEKSIVLQAKTKFDEASTPLFTDRRVDLCQPVDNATEINSLRLTVSPEDLSKIPVRISVAEARRLDAIGKTVILKGWVRTRRDSKAGFSFIELNDGSSFGNVQILAPNTLKNYEKDILRLIR